MPFIFEFGKELFDVFDIIFFRPQFPPCSILFGIMIGRKIESEKNKQN